jgi:hypothetical protein
MSRRLPSIRYLESRYSSDRDWILYTHRRDLEDHLVLLSDGSFVSCERGVAYQRVLTKQALKRVEKAEAHFAR